MADIRLLQSAVVQSPYVYLYLLVEVCEEFMALRKEAYKVKHWSGIRTDVSTLISLVEIDLICSLHSVSFRILVGHYWA